MNGFNRKPKSDEPPQVIHVGVSPAGVEWNLYRKPNETNSELAKREERMRGILERMKERSSKRVLRVRLTDAQMALVHDESARVERPLYNWGRTYVEGRREDLQFLAEGLAFRRDDDHEAEVRGGAMKELTDAQVAFGVRSRVQCINETIRKLMEA